MSIYLRTEPIISDWTDYNGHMNLAFYIHLFAKGDVALSVSLTAVMSLLSAISVPIVLVISLGIIGGSSLPESISLTGIAFSMFLIVTLPVLLGMGVRSFLNSFTLKIEKSARFISTFLFVLVLFGAVMAERENVVNYFAQTGLVVLTLNVLMMIIAFYWSGIFGTGISQKKAIAIECGLQNGTLAIFVGTTVFGGGIYIIPAATYSLIMGAVLMQLYILFRGTEATWAFFNFMFIMMTLIAGASFYGFEIDKLGLTKGSTREGYISTGVLAILWAILCFGLSDKIYI